MERREMLKGFAALGSMFFMPEMKVSGNQIETRLHLIGLGATGSSVIRQFRNKGVIAKYSRIIRPDVWHLKKDMDTILFEPIWEHHDGTNYKKGLELTPEMKQLFNENDRKHEALV